MPPVLPPILPPRMARMEEDEDDEDEDDEDDEDEDDEDEDDEDRGRFFFSAGAAAVFVATAEFSAAESFCPAVACLCHVILGFRKMGVGLRPLRCMVRWRRFKWSARSGSCRRQTACHCSFFRGL